MVTRLECKTDGHNKFWSIELEDDAGTLIKYGAIGAKERETRKDHGTAAQAKKFMESQIKSKKKKGYVEVTPPAKPDAAKEPPSKKPKVDADFQCFEMTTGGHNKFWRIKACGSSTVVEYGAIGAAPRTSEKDHGTPEKAKKFMASMIGKKKKEGYVQTGAGAGAGTGADAGGSGPPKMYVFGTACSAFELEKRRDDWDGPDGEDDFCSGDVHHGTMNDAPPAAKAIADEMNAAMPDLENIQCCLSSESSDGGEIIVIGNPGSDPKLGCLKALGILKDNWEGALKAATLQNKDWKEYKQGFIHDPDDEFDPKDEFDDDEDMWKEYNQIKKGTEVMSAKLTKHFVFNFLDSLAVAPIIYGGYAGDGSIVGILSSRVWT